MFLQISCYNSLHLVFLFHIQLTNFLQLQFRWIQLQSICWLQLGQISESLIPANSIMTYIQIFKYIVFQPKIILPGNWYRYFYFTIHFCLQSFRIGNGYGCQKNIKSNQKYYKHKLFITNKIQRTCSYTSKQTHICYKSRPQ